MIERPFRALQNGQVAGHEETAEAAQALCHKPFSTVTDIRDGRRWILIRNDDGVLAWRSTVPEKVAPGRGRGAPARAAPAPTPRLPYKDD